MRENLGSELIRPSETKERLSAEGSFGAFLTRPRRGGGGKKRVDKMGEMTYVVRTTFEALEDLKEDGREGDPFAGFE